MNQPLLLAQELHDISPPVDYSLIPLWAIFAAVFVLLALLGGAGWFIRRWWRRPKPEISPRTRALGLLERARAEIAQLNPYQFSIRGSDILRRYVMEQYQLPVTRQTSVEFLEGLARVSPFSEDEGALLGVAPTAVLVPLLALLLILSARKVWQHG